MIIAAIMFLKNLSNRTTITAVANIPNIDPSIGISLNSYCKNK